MRALVEGDTAAVHTAAVQHRLHACEITAADDVALVLQLRISRWPRTPGGAQSEAQRAGTFALLRHLVLHTAPQQPLVLVMENLHWSVPPQTPGWRRSWSGCRGRGVGPGDLSARLSAHLGGACGGDAGPAPTLHTEDSRTVVQAMLGPVALPRHGSGRLWRRGGASLLFGGIHVVRRGTGWGGHTGCGTQTVHAVLAARMDRLLSEAKRLLQWLR